MKAEDTVTKTTIYNCHNTLEERLAEQAEISFRAGIGEGAKYIVSWYKELKEDKEDEEDEEERK